LGATHIGGKKAYKTLISKHGTTEDGKSKFHTVIGAEGGKKGRTGGFYGDRERARLYGSLGGKLSRISGPKPTPKQRARILTSWGKTYKESLANLERVHKQANKDRQG
jgi:hypothetical protein